MPRAPGVHLKRSASGSSLGEPLDARSTPGFGVGGSGPGSLVSGSCAAYRFPSYFAEQRMEQQRVSDDGAPVAGALVDAPVDILTDDSNLATAAD